MHFYSSSSQLKRDFMRLYFCVEEFSYRVTNVGALAVQSLWLLLCFAAGCL